jgi:hypothetical protein
MNIKYQNNQASIKVTITFKNKINVLNFFDLGNIKTEIDFDQKNINL